MDRSGIELFWVQLGPWLTFERQATILGGVILLFGLWLSGAIEPFALGIPAYAVYIVLHTPFEWVGLVGIEGSLIIFWVSAFLWLYTFCAVLLYVTIALEKTLGL